MLPTLESIRLISHLWRWFSGFAWALKFRTTLVICFALLGRTKHITSTVLAQSMQQPRLRGLNIIPNCRWGRLKPDGERDGHWEAHGTVPVAHPGPQCRVFGHHVTQFQGHAHLLCIADLPHTDNDQLTLGADPLLLQNGKVLSAPIIGKDQAPLQKEGAEG